MRRLLLAALVLFCLFSLARADDAAATVLLKPARVFDGVRNKKNYTTGAGAEGICRIKENGPAGW
jgi:hypothetical protein